MKLRAAMVAGAAALAFAGTATAAPHYFVRAGNSLTGGEQFDSSTPVTAQSVSPIVQDFHAVAGPIGSNKVDRRAPSISLDVPASQLYVLNAAVAASYDCADGGSGVATCTAPVASGANVDTGSVGARTFKVTAVDAVGNQSSKSVDYTVGYAVKLLYDPARPTRTVKLQLHDANGTNVSAAAIVLQAQSIDGSIPLSRMFTYVSWCAQYRFALPRGLSAGSHALYFTASGDPTVHAATFTTR